MREEDDDAILMTPGLYLLSPTVLSSRVSAAVRVDLTTAVAVAAAARQLLGASLAPALMPCLSRFLGGGNGQWKPLGGDESHNPTSPSKKLKKKKKKRNDQASVNAPNGDATKEAPPTVSTASDTAKLTMLLRLYAGAVRCELGFR